MDLVSSPDHTRVVVLTDHVDKVSKKEQSFFGRFSFPLENSPLIFCPLLLSLLPTEWKIEDRSQMCFTFDWSSMCL